VVVEEENMWKRSNNVHHFFVHHHRRSMGIGSIPWSVMLALVFLLSPNGFVAPRKRKHFREACKEGFTAALRRALDRAAGGVKRSRVSLAKRFCASAGCTWKAALSTSLMKAECAAQRSKERKSHKTEQDYCRLL
jgi:hypothetical protein